MRICDAIKKTQNCDKGIRPSVVQFCVDMYEIGVYTLS